VPPQDSTDSSSLIVERLGEPIPGAEHAEPPPSGFGDHPPDFEAKPDEPPKPKREIPEPPKPRALRAAELESQLEDFFGMIALGIMTTGDEHCANVVATQAKPLSEAWAELAKKNTRVKRMIEMMLQGSAWGSVITVTAATVIPIAAHHGLYPQGFPMPFTFGVGPPPPESSEVKRAGDTTVNETPMTPPVRPPNVRPPTTPPH
jgi:hypothetical protein